MSGVTETVKSGYSCCTSSVRIARPSSGFRSKPITASNRMFFYSRSTWNPWTCLTQSWLSTLCITASRIPAARSSDVL